MNKDDFLKCVEIGDGIYVMTYTNLKRYPAIFMPGFREKGESTLAILLTPQERRLKTFERLKKQKIAVNEYLLLLPPGESVKLKRLEEVKKRALGSMISI